MSLTAPATPVQQLSVADLRGFGERFGIDFQFPGLGNTSQPANRIVSRGSVVEMALSSGLHLTHSCLDVLQPYESLSTRNTAFFLLVILEGSVRLNIAGRQHLVQAGMALTTHLDQHGTLHAIHEHNQHLKTLTLALDTTLDPAQQSMPWLLDSFPNPDEPVSHLWCVPPHLLPSLQQLHAWHHLGTLQQRLLMEGLALQLLAYGIGDMAPARNTMLAPGERNRLDKIRQQLDHAPSLDYSVEQLAEQAAMSPSSFRSKFRQMFGMPVFDYLRDRRLALARQYLLQGYSVQQAAHLSGYRHATNFATAFRKHYGTAPSSLN